jgi:predicted CopG family antitoxin
MHTMIELSDRTYARLRAKAAERGTRVSAIIEEALERLLEPGRKDDLASVLVEAEGVWSDGEVKEWERTRREAWASWPAEDP